MQPQKSQSNEVLRVPERVHIRARIIDAAVRGVNETVPFTPEAPVQEKLASPETVQASVPFMPVVRYAEQQGLADDAREQLKGL